MDIAKTVAGAPRAATREERAVRAEALLVRLAEIWAQHPEAGVPDHGPDANDFTCEAAPYLDQACALAVEIKADDEPIWQVRVYYGAVAGSVLFDRCARSWAEVRRLGYLATFPHTLLMDGAEVRVERMPGA